MSTVHTENGSIQIPDGIHDLGAFRRWVYSDEFPEQGKICYLDGEVWVDMSPEHLFAHNSIKTEFTRVLASVAMKTNEGIYFSDGALVTNEKANLSCEPDGSFVFHKSLK